MINMEGNLSGRIEVAMHPSRGVERTQGTMWSQTLRRRVIFWYRTGQNTQPRGAGEEGDAFREGGNRLQRETSSLTTFGGKEKRQIFERGREIIFLYPGEGGEVQREGSPLAGCKRACALCYN